MNSSTSKSCIYYTENWKLCVSLNSNLNGFQGFLLTQSIVCRVKKREFAVGRAWQLCVGLSGRLQPGEKLIASNEFSYIDTSQNKFPIVVRLNCYQNFLKNYTGKKNIFLNYQQITKHL